MTSAPRACIIGHPVKHSRSPMIHGFWLKTMQLAGSYGREDVPPEAAEAFIRGLAAAGYVGGNVTMPNKEAAFRAVAHRTARAEALGAVNTVWYRDGELWGDNTDILGFLANLDEGAPGWDAGMKKAVVLGAGGASVAIVAGLIERGATRILIANRTIERAKEIAARFGSVVEARAWPPTAADLSAADLLVNTTSRGMNGKDDLELDLAPLPVHAVVTDAVYVPLETGLLRAAKGRGLRTVDGLGMLLHQAVPGFEHWFGRRPHVTPELRRLIEADL
jgi:shikimate dehydrogenase